MRKKQVCTSEGGEGGGVFVEFLKISNVNEAEKGRAEESADSEQRIGT